MKNLFGECKDKDCFVLNIPNNFKDNVDEITKNACQHMSKQLGKKFTEIEIEQIKKKALTMLNEAFKSICSYKVGFILDLDYVVLKEFKYIDDDTIILTSGVRKNQKIAINNIQEYFSKALEFDYYTAVLYCIL